MSIGLVDPILTSIAKGLDASTGSCSAAWDLSQIPSATYYLMAVANDGMTPPASAYYAEPVAVDHGLVPAPTGLTGTRSGTRVSLSWTPGSRGAVQGYEIRYTDDPETAGYPFATTTLSSGSAEVDGLDPAKSYRFCVVAFDSQGNASLESNAVTFPKPGSTPGDCDGDGAVSIGEVQKAINMFLGALPPGCGVDANGDGVVTIGEVQKVINAFLGVAPGVSVSVTPSSATVPPGGTQQFTATVTGSTNTAVTWTIVEGSAGGSVSPAGFYTAPATTGAYHIKATSQADTSKSVTATVTVSGGTCSLTCTASANPASGQSPLPVNFTATATPSNCSGGVTYAWTFGDGGSSSQQNPTHTYASAGTFSWSMTASIDGQTCSKSGSVTVIAGGDGTPLTLGVPVDGSISSPTENGAWNWYYLDLGPGAQAVDVTLTGLTGDVDLYVRAGQKPDLSTYDCRSWNNGTEPEACGVSVTGPARLWIGVTNFATSVAIAYTLHAAAGGSGSCAIHSCSATPYAQGLAVHFTNQYNATGCTGTPAVLWMFGDGAASQEAEPIHVYAVPGTYHFEVNVALEDHVCNYAAGITVTEN